MLHVQIAIASPRAPFRKKYFRARDGKTAMPSEIVFFANSFSTCSPNLVCVFFCACNLHRSQLNLHVQAVISAIVQWRTVRLCYCTCHCSSARARANTRANVRLHLQINLQCVDAQANAHPHVHDSVHAQTNAHPHVHMQMLVRTCTCEYKFQPTCDCTCK